MRSTTKITRKGQITLPARFRRELDLKEGQHVLVTLDPTRRDQLIVRSADDISALKGIIKTDKPYDPAAIEKAVLKYKAQEWRKKLRRMGF